MYDYKYQPEEWSLDTLEQKIYCKSNSGMQTMHFEKKAKLKRTGGSTKSLHTHLQGRHAMNVLKREEPSTPSHEAGHEIQ